MATALNPGEMSGPAPDRAASPLPSSSPPVPAPGQPDVAPEPRAVILAAVDLGHEPATLLAAAALQARGLKDADLHLVHVAVSPSGRVLTTGEMLHDARDRFEQYTEQIQREFFGRVFVHVLVGEPWRDVVQLATILHADLVLVGTHGRTGVARALLGSVAELIVRHAPCAVLVVRPKEHQTDDPLIEPPCPECLKTQKATGGESLWCARHAGKRPRPHLHYEMPAGYGAGSMFLRRE